MNKALHVFIYLFLALTGAALWFEFQLNEKRTEMKDRNRMQEDFIMRVASITEKGDDYKSESQVKILLDTQPVTAEEDGKEIDEDSMENLLDVKGYEFALEKTTHNFLKWGEAQRNGLRQIYVMDDTTGKPMLDGTDKMTRGSEEDKLLEELYKSLDSQKTQLLKTREALPVLREQLERVAKEVNSLKPVIRKDKATIIEKEKQIAQLEENNQKLDNENKKRQAQIEELNAELASAKDEVTAAKDETEQVKEALAKEKELTTQLKQLASELQRQTAGGGAQTELGKAVTSVPFGDKGKIIVADNENMFAIIEFTDAAMKEIKGEDLSRPLPLMTFSVRRPGYNGPAGEIIGSIRIRQEVSGKNYLICDILSDWQQTPLLPNDVVFAN